MPRFTTVIPTDGPSGNVFVIVGTAGRLMRELGVPAEEITGFYRRVTDAKSYGEACAIVEEYFPLSRENEE